MLVIIFVSFLVDVHQLKITRKLVFSKNQPAGIFVALVLFKYYFHVLSVLAGAFQIT
jgi:hypothetical protein